MDDQSGDDVPQCYHWDCQQDATRELVRTQDYISPGNKHVPCCDDHDPMRDPGDYLRPIDGSGQQQLFTDGGRVQDTEGVPRSRLTLAHRDTCWLLKCDRPATEWVYGGNDFAAEVCEPCHKQLTDTVHWEDGNGII